MTVGAQPQPSFQLCRFQGREAPERETAHHLQTTHVLESKPSTARWRDFITKESPGQLCGHAEHAVRI